MKKPKFIESIEKISCTGGGDTCEDVAGGLQKALEEIEWKSKYKMVCLVADAPAHGDRFHEPGLGDDYPKDESAAEWVAKLADNEYSFIALEFTSQTNKMFDEFKKIYTERQRDKFFYRYPITIGSNKKEDTKIISSEIAKAITGSLKDTVSRQKRTKKKM